MNQTVVNVAPQSTKGHYVKNVPVVNISEKAEAFFIKEKSEIVSENHGTLGILEKTLTMPQKIYNPYTKSMERSKD
jgi:hypothetical protein